MENEAGTAALAGPNTRRTLGDGLANSFNPKDFMYGLIGRMTATPGQRDALVAILIEGTAKMPGCLSYVVALDTMDQNALWITEVWDHQKSHQASLTLPVVKDAIAKGRPLIAGVSNRVETTPIGGVGLS